MYVGRQSRPTYTNFIFAGLRPMRPARPIANRLKKVWLAHLSKGCKPAFVPRGEDLR